MRRILDQSTLVPISFVIALLGGSGFITKMYFENEANASIIQEVKVTVEEQKKENHRVKDDFLDRLARIETKVDILLKQKQQED